MLGLIAIFITAFFIFSASRNSSFLSKDKQISNSLDTNSITQSEVDQINKKVKNQVDQIFNQVGYNTSTLNVSPPMYFNETRNLIDRIDKNDYDTFDDIIRKDGSSNKFSLPDLIVSSEVNSRYRPPIPTVNISGY